MRANEWGQGAGESPRRHAKNAGVSTKTAGWPRAQAPWKLFDDLIDLLPADLTVTEALMSRVVLVGNSAGGVGTASTDRGGRRERVVDRRIVGRSLRDVAALTKSWDFELASLGVAALNSWFNSDERLVAFAHSTRWRLDRCDRDIFDSRGNELAGQKVVLIGHFTRGIRSLADAVELTVLERDPRGSDLPDSACEYILPTADAVFITGMTIANKTLPHLLELAANARVFLVGPSVPCAPEVFSGSVQHIAGSHVADPARARELAALGARTPEMRPTTSRFTLDL